MASDFTEGLPPFVKRAEEIVAHILRRLKERGVIVEAGRRERVIPEMSPGEKRSYDAAYAVLKGFLELKAIERAAESIALEDLHDLTEEEEQALFDDPDLIVQIAKRKRQERLRAEQRDGSAAS